MNALDMFMLAPNAENLKKIKNNCWMLTRVFQKDEALAKQFFKFEEWFQICKDLSGLTDEEKATHEFEYELSYGAVAILLKDVKTPSDGLFRTAIEYDNIPYGYINPAFRNGQ